jgi:hypothetical protein
MGYYPGPSLALERVRVRRTAWRCWPPRSKRHDNVLIDILCWELKKEGVPIPLVFPLWDMMWEKHFYFFDGQDVAFMRTGYKDLYLKGRFYLHSCKTSTRAWLMLVCTLCAWFCNMRMIWTCISRESMLRLLGTPCRRLWQDWWLGLGFWVFNCLQTSQKWWFFLGNIKILRFWCGSVRLHFEMSLNLNSWE